MTTADASDARKGSLALNVARYEASDATELTLMARVYGKEAARGLVVLLHEAGWIVVAHIHPGHLASQRVARGVGLSPTAGVRDGEIRWVSLPRHYLRSLRPHRRSHLGAAYRAPAQACPTGASPGW